MRSHNNAIYLQNAVAVARKTGTTHFTEMLIKWKVSHCRGVHLPMASVELGRQFYGMESPIFL
jgi:hypothetical protein